MSGAHRVHVAYTAADAAAFLELTRHLSALPRSYGLTLSHSGEYAAPELEAMSPQADEAELFILLLTPRFALERRALIERLREVATKKAGRGRLHLADRVIPVLLEPTAWPYSPRDACIPARSSLGELTSRDLGWSEVVRALRARLDGPRTDRRGSGAGQGTPPGSRAAAPPRPPTARDEAAPLHGLPRTRYALLVGVNRFLDGRAFPSLRYCVNDVLALRETLDQQGYLVRLVHDDMAELPLKPLRENVLYHLEDLCSRAQPDDLLLIHFACHGFVCEGRQYLAVYDTRHGRAAQTGLALSEIEAQLRRSAARRRILILDACHSGAALTRGADEDEFIRAVFERAEGFVRIAASTAQQKAQEWQEKQMGAFTYFLNEALRGGARNPYGLVTVQSAANYVLHRLRKWSFESLGREQEPTIQYEGLGEIVLADLRPQPGSEGGPAPARTPNSSGNLP